MLSKSVSWRLLLEDYNLGFGEGTRRRIKGKMVILHVSDLIKGKKSHFKLYW